MTPRRIPAIWFSPLIVAGAMFMGPYGAVWVWGWLALLYALYVQQWPQWVYMALFFCFGVTAPLIFRG
jgi:hypothetical protein